MQVIEKRAFNLLQHIITNDSYAIEKAMKKLDCSERQITYDLVKINDMLKKENIAPIKISRRKFIITDESKSAIQNLDFSGRSYIIGGENKIWLICIMLFCAKEPLGLSHFMADFKSSKNTVLNDLKKLTGIAKQYRVELNYTRKQGYHFEGKPKNIRTLVLYSISSIKDNYLCKELITLAVNDQEYPARFAQTERIVKDFIERFKLPVIGEYLIQSIYFISILPYHCKSVNYQPVSYQKQLWMHLPLYSAVTNLYESLESDIPEEEIEYLLILLLSMTLGNQEYFQVYSKESLFLQSLSTELANRFEVITGAVFKNKQTVADNILMHLQPAYFRLKYGIPVVNPALEQIKKDYNEIFSICRLVLEPFSDYLDCFIPDDEIGYIAVHFLAMLETIEPEKMRRRAIIVCQNGLASSVMMKNQLKKMFPEILFLKTYNMEEFKKIPNNSYDIIFTTSQVPLSLTDKYVFVISPILTTDEKFALSDEVYSTVFGIKKEGVTVSSILEIVSEYAQITDEKALAAALQNHLNKKYKPIRKDGLPVIKDLLTKETIQFADEVPDWETAIRLGARPLIENDSIEESYIEAMIANVKEHGPYIVICPYVAIPHAQNKVGINKLGMSFLKLKKEVNILDNPEKAVKVLITLAAVDDKTHLKALAQLSNLLSDPDSREKLVECETLEEVMTMLETVS